MKRLFILLFTIISCSVSSFAQVIPIIEVRINNTPTAKDDYVNASYIACSVRLFNGASFTDNIPVTLRNIPFNTGGQVLFSATGGTSVGAATLDLIINKDNSFTTFYAQACSRRSATYRSCTEFVVNILLKQLNTNEVGKTTGSGSDSGSCSSSSSASLSSPTKPNNSTRAANAAILIATFAAPPGRACARCTETTGTGASGEIRSVWPNQ